MLKMSQKNPKLVSQRNEFFKKCPLSFFPSEHWKIWLFGGLFFFLFFFPSGRWEMGRLGGASFFSFFFTSGRPYK